MRRRVLFVLGLIVMIWLDWPARLLAQDYSGVVAQAKADLIAAGENLSGPCGAFKITKLAAWRLRSQGIGLLEKSSGNQCEFYAVDILVPSNQGGRHYDILSDGGGANGVQWNLVVNPETGAAILVDMERWRAPLPAEPGSPAPTPTPTPQPVPTPIPTIDWGPVLTRFDRLEAQDQMIRTRVDDIEDLIEKRVAELAAQLEKHDNEPSWARKVFGNPYVQAILAGAGTCAATQCWRPREAEAK